MSFDNKVVLVTGASSGIGAATAILFAKEGANVAIVGRNEEKLKSVTAKIENIGKKPLVIKADVSKDDEVNSIIEQTIDEFGQLDVLVNNAGLSVHGTIMDGNVLDAYDKIMPVNVRSLINLTTLAAPYLIKTKGNIVNVSSVAGFFIPKDLQNLAYCVSKAAVNHFTKGAALELAPSGVRVNSVNPGPVRTDFLQNAGSHTTWDDFVPKLLLGKVGEPEEIADLIAYLASDKAKSITGALFVSDNGRLLDH